MTWSHRQGKEKVIARVQGGRVLGIEIKIVFLLLKVLISLITQISH